MSSPILTRTPDRTGRARWTAPTAAIVGFSLVAVIGLVAGSLGPAHPVDIPADTRAADPAVSREYAAGIDQVARAAGTITEFELKPAVGRIDREGPDHGLGPVGWADALQALRDGLAGQAPPVGAEAAHATYLDALDRYVELARTLAEAAAAADPAEISRLLDEVVALGRAADGRWDEASDLLQAHLASIGADPPPPSSP